MTSLLLAAVFYATSYPLEMPTAEAYVVTETDGSKRLEDRYDPLDMWVSRAVLGRWYDDQGRIFTVCDLEKAPPLVRDGVTATRVTYTSNCVDLNVKKPNRELADAIGILSGLELPEEWQKPHQLPRGMKEVRYYQGTNQNVIVCAYLPLKPRHWQLAMWNLVEGDVFDDRLEEFERNFFDKGEWESPPKLESRQASDGERELMRTDARASIAAYPEWRFTGGGEFAILDSTADGGDFAQALTNALPTLRSHYKAAMPSPIDGSNTLAFARIYPSRERYLEVVGEEMSWSVAYWCPQRREVVAYLPNGGKEKLMKTLRHEFFHQYLSYACAMMTAAPWLNEGYAEYFEDETASPFDGEVDYAALAALLPSVFEMDYTQFYAGSNSERSLKYSLAHSIAVFLEQGASEVRQRPFDKVKSDYIKTLLDTQDMHKATEVALPPELRRLFCSEWLKFWKKR